MANVQAGGGIAAIVYDDPTESTIVLGWQGTASPIPAVRLPVADAQFLLASRLGVAVSVVSTAGPATLLFDTTGDSLDGYPGCFAPLNGQVLFTTFAGGAGLFRTDGTPGGTVKIADGFTGTCLQRAGDVLLYARVDDSPSPQTYYYRLWRTDGTAGGTTRLTSALRMPGLYSSASFGTTNPFFTEVNGTVFFVGIDPDHGAELWKTDGSATGTVLVKDVRTGVDDGLSQNGLFYLPEFAHLNGRLYFFADDGVHGKELWTSDGTDAGTALVKDLYPGAGNGVGTSGVFAAGAALYFFGTDGTPGLGQQLWKSDGTAAGTVRLSNVAGGLGLRADVAFVRAGSNVFFVANDGEHGSELWKTNGSAAGTSMVKDIDPGSASGVNGTTLSVLSAGGPVFFLAYFQGVGLWKSDGTEAGTVVVSPKRASSIQGANGRLYLRDNSTFGGILDDDLGVSDGTTGGTGLLQDIMPGPRDSIPAGFTPIGDRIFFSARDPFVGIEAFVMPSLPPAADLLVALTGTARAPLGGTITLVSTIGNDGGSDAQDVVVTLSPPPGVNFLANSGACATAFPCALGLLEVGQTRTITTVLEVPANFSGAGVVSSTVSVSSTTADPFLANNSASSSTIVTLPARLFTLSPCRAIDTRVTPAGAFAGPPLAGGGSRSFALAGRCGIPASAKAVSVNVTVTAPTGPGDLRLFPAGTPLPLVSAINYGAGQTRANNAIVVLGAQTDFTTVCAQAGGTVDFILDVNGYFE